MDFAWMAFSQAWQVTALIVCVLLANRLFAKNRPHLAYALWLVVLIKCVTPPLWSSPSSAFSWLQTVWRNNGQPVSVSHESRPAVRFDFANDPVPYSDDVVLRWQPGVAPVDATQTVDAGRSQDAAALNGWVLLAAVWAFGIGLAVLVSAYRWLTCIRKLRRSPRIESPELEALLARLARQLNVRRQVGLLVTTSRVGPAVIGLLRPLIVLPQAVVRGKQPEALEAIVAHELIHVRRGDLWLGLLQVCAKAVWWFYPPVWWASRLSTREAERCCDEEVIGELGCDPKRYARSLLEVLELRRTLQPVPAFPGMKPVEVTSQRLERIMQLGQGCHKRTPRWCWAVMLLLAAAALPGAALIVGEDESETHDFLSRSSAQVEQTFQAAAAVDLTGDSGEEWPAKLVDRQPLVVASYMSEKVIAELAAELGGDEAAALQKFGNRLIAESRLSDQPIPLQDRVRIWDGTVTMAASPEEHQRLQTVMERLEKYGTAQIKFDIRFVSVSEGVFQQKIKDWELTQLDLGHEGIGQQVRDRFEDMDRPLPTETSKPRAKAGAATTTNLPALYKIVEAEEAERLLEELQEEKRTSILAAPKVTMFNGQSATIRDSVQQPFVVGVTAVGDEEREAQPQIRVVETGKVVRVRPLLRDANKLWIDYDIEVSHIQKVSTTTVRVAGVREPVTLQTPEVFTARIESAVEFELGKTVLIGGFTAVPEKGRTDRLLVTISAQRKELANANAIHIEESPAGRLVFGSGVASDAGVLGALAAFDEQFVSHFNLIEPAAAKPAATSSIEEKLLVRGKSTEQVYPAVYNVADLLAEDLKSITPQDFQSGYEDTMRRNLDLLAAVIPQRVAVGSWSDEDGPGAIEVFATNLSLVISQTKNAHREVASFLNALRRQLGLAASEAATPKAPAAIVHSDRLVQRVYNVAELVIPLPGLPSNQATAKDAAVADFDTLIDLITSTVAVETWEAAGGAGAIEPFPTNLSLVVSQSTEVHEQVSDLLRQLRKLQDVQVTVETCFLRLPADSLVHESRTDGQTHETRVTPLVQLANGAAALTSPEAHFLTHAIKGLPQASSVRGPKVTVFSGQEATVSLSKDATKPDVTLRIQAVCADDRRSVRLAVGVGAGKAVDLGPIETLAAGHSLLRDVTDDIEPTAIGFAPLAKAGVPARKGTRLFQNKGTSVEMQTLVLITPHIIIQEEQEELLGLEFDPK